MSAHQTDRNHFERQILFARPIFVLLALLAAFEQPASRQERRSVSFLIAYLIVSLVITQVERLLRNRSWHLPLASDLLALGYFIGAHLPSSFEQIHYKTLLACLVGALGVAGYELYRVKVKGKTKKFFLLP